MLWKTSRILSSTLSVSNTSACRDRNVKRELGECVARGYRSRSAGVGPVAAASHAAAGAPCAVADAHTVRTADCERTRILTTSRAPNLVK